MDAGIVGGTIGGVVGVIGGAIGTWCSIRNTQSPREKAFMIKASVVAWVGVSLFIVLLQVLPHPYRLWLWVAYGVLLPLAIIKINKGIAQIRAAQSEG